MKEYSRTLVLGATGKTGSRITSRLRQLGQTVRIGSRSAVVPFDWDDPGTWEAVLKDMDVVYISFQPDLAVPGAVQAIRAFAAKAVGSGVQNLVLLSGRGEPEAQECEKVIMDGGVSWTIVRASWFCQNFSESFMLEPILAGYVALPAGDIREPFVDADDVADVAVAALTEEGHDGKVYEVTGPRLLTFKEAIDSIAAAMGKSIHYQEVITKAYTTMLARHGVPDVLVSLVSYLFSEVLDGRNAYVTDGIEQALGRKATDFSEYVGKAFAVAVTNC